MQYLDWFADSTVAVTDLALACCGIESGLAVPLSAKSMADPGPGVLRVIVVSGTISTRLAPGVVEAIARISAECSRCGAPRPIVIAFGACACGGGPYWDSLTVVNGMAALQAPDTAAIAADRWIPGCPPPAGALARAIEEIRAEALAGAA